MRKLFSKGSLKKFTLGSLWAFPILLVLTLSLLTVFKIHSSSIGIYHTSLYDSSQQDPDLLFGHPKPIRSDEWKVRTPFLAFQDKVGAPKYNEYIGSGRDLAKQTSLPAKDWASVFKSHTWSYFVLPLENAFSFQLWFPLLLLIFVAYVFIYKLSRNKKLSILLSTSFAISPFFFWWYQAEFYMAISYALATMLLAMRIADNKRFPFSKSNKISNLSYVSAFSYIGISFGLLLYVPYLLPITIVMLAFILGYIFEKKVTKEKVKQYLGISIASLLVILSVGFLYVNDHKEMIKATANTVYPGQRSIEAGGQKIISVFDGFLMPLLQSGTRGPHYYANQSEASNFILLLPFLLIPGFFLLIYRYKKTKVIMWTLLFIQLVALLFLFRMFVPFADWFYQILQLDRVLHNRLLIGLGFAGFIQLILIVNSLDILKKVPIKKMYTAVLAYCAACFALLILVGDHVINKYPQFLQSHKIMFVLAFLFTVVIGLFLINKKILASVSLLIFTLMSSFYILPIYKEMDFFEESKITNKIEEVSTIDDSWVVLDSEVYESVPLMAGRGMVSGQQTYPDLDFWSQIDKTGEKEHVYNRQAHALFLTNTLEPDPTNRYNVKTISDDLELVKGNVFKVKFQCNDFTYNNIDFALITHRIEFKCLKLVEQAEYPKKTFYIYEVVRPAN